MRSTILCCSVYFGPEWLHLGVLFESAAFLSLLYSGFNSAPIHRYLTSRPLLASNHRYFARNKEPRANLAQYFFFSCEYRDML